MNNLFKLDSLRCRIPLSKVTVLNPDLIRTTQKINLDNGELIKGTERVESYLYGYDQSDPYERLHAQSGKVSDYLISCKFNIAKIPTGFNYDTGRKLPVYDDFLIISISAKLLKHDYFTGINSGNIGIIYEHLIKCGIAEFSFLDFMHSQIVDVDVCRDVICSTDLANVMQYVKEYSKYPDLIKTYNKSTNKGIQFSRRPESTISIPYMKLYNKRIQMEYEQVEGSGFRKNFQFAEYFLGGICTINKDLVRYELNIRNKEHLTHYELPNTLGEFLEVKDPKFREIQADYWKRWIKLPDQGVTKAVGKREGARLSYPETFLFIHLYERFAGKFPEKAEVHQYAVSVLTEKFPMLTGKPMPYRSLMRWKTVRIPYMVDRLMPVLENSEIARKDSQINSRIEERNRLLDDLKTFGIPIYDYLFQ